MTTAPQADSIRHRAPGTTLAEGPRGWGITSFEDTLYISRKHLRSSGFKLNWTAGPCGSKLLYIWFDLNPGAKGKGRNLPWL